MKMKINTLLTLILLLCSGSFTKIIIKSANSENLDANLILDSKNNQNQIQNSATITTPSSTPNSNHCIKD